MHCAKCFFFETSVGDDICNRCGRAYLPEANVYLGLLVLVTGGLAWTLRHLITGEADPFVRPEVGLGAWCTWPVSMVEQPAWGLVLGAWLGMLAAAPVLTGILYGKRGGWLLTILVGLLGPSLAFAGAVAGGVWVAAGHTVRLPSKLASGLLGMIPPAVYLFVAAALTDWTAVEAEVAPAVTDASALLSAGRPLPLALRSMAYVPPAMALLVSAGAAALVVAVGRADLWHVRWPGSVLTVLTAGPILALAAFVGVDDIRYAMVVGPGPTPGPWAPPDATEADRLRAFLRRYPDSPRAPGLRARLARRLMRSAVQGEAPTRRTEALGLWEQVRDRHPGSPFAADACLYLGDADAQGGLFEAARDHWQAALDRASAVQPPDEQPLATFSILTDLFSVGRRLQARRHAERLADLRKALLLRLAVLDENHTGTPAGNKALALYFRAVALRGSNPYRQALLAARQAEPDGALADNIAFDLALLAPDDADRLAALAAVAEKWPESDGAMRAHVQAAQVLVARSETDPGALRAARAHLLRAQTMLAARRRRNPDDRYVAALADRVEKELVYVQAQLRAPEAEE
ncbi:MAG: hypothetical protein R6X20_09090 [Phycisphaerae bacterium]